MPDVAVIGATTWGNTLGRLLANKGLAVTIWARTEAEAEQLTLEHQDRMPGNAPSGRLRFTDSLDEALRAVVAVILAVPSQRLRQNVKHIRGHIGSSMVLVSGAKGLEADTCKRMSEVIAEEAGVRPSENVCALSGPNLSKEIDRGLPASSVVASADHAAARKVQSLLDSPDFSVYVCDDIVGVELCGALKNVIALGAGMLDGLELGNNAKATLITLGWREVVSMGVALGASTGTFYGLAGLGDLVATGNSPLSRNHYVGYELGRGRPLSAITASMTSVAEGIDTTIAVHKLIGKLGLEAPIIELVHSVLFGSLSPAGMAARFRSGLRRQAAA